MSKGTGGRLRLLELIVDLYIFAVCAVVCALLLVRAQQVSAGSERLTQAVYLAQSAAETWKAAGETRADNGDLGGGEYSVDLEEAEDGSARITVLWRGESLYSLEGVRRNG